jgi:uncharacterized membrane protein
MMRIRDLLVFMQVLLLLSASMPGHALAEGESKQLILVVYVDRAGKALVTGYAEDIQALAFLDASQHHYDNETGQLYALTNALTWKSGDDWRLNFSAIGYYENYHTTFYLPGEVKVRGIQCSPGLEYLVSASNQSLVVDIQGYEVGNPDIAIDYLQPLEVVEGRAHPGLYSLVAFLLGLTALSAAFIIRRRRKLPIEASSSGLTAELPSEQGKATGNGSEESEAQSSSGAGLPLEISNEMAAVMKTLTPRESIVLRALIDRGGRMTQADIRYETGIPKSSLTGILLSLERRKLIVKKESGRTNVIELSEWFLSGKEGS